jgi:hypothetical protein
MGYFDLANINVLGIALNAALNAAPIFSLSPARQRARYFPHLV